MSDVQLPGGGFFSLPDAGGSRQLPGGAFITTTSESFATYDVETSESASATDSVSGVALRVGVFSEALTAASTFAGALSTGATLAEALAAVDRVGAVSSSGTTPTPNSVVSARASPHLYLTDDFPVTLTTELGSFAEEVVVPDRYGDLRRSRFKLIRMTSTLFVAARHPMEITRAFTGNLETKSFESRTQSLGGKNCTVVEFAAPVPIGTEATASGLGKRSELTGALIENPADILTDIMALADRDDPWWNQLRGECSAAGIRLAGSFSDAGTIRDRIDAVTDSCGAIWCPDMARLYPAPIEGFRIPLNRFKAFDLKASASPTDTADSVRVAFAFDEAEGKAQSFIVLEAFPQRYGGTVLDVALPMVHSAAVAESVGKRMLRRFASERIEVKFTTPLTDFTRPGTWAVLSDHPEWPRDEDANLMFADAMLDHIKRQADITAEAMVLEPTNITLTKHSLGANSIGAGGVEVDYRNGIATLTVRDNNDKPLSGAYVSLDGEAPKKTNAQGQVAFVTKAGMHELAVEAKGFEPYTLEFEL